MSTLVAPMQDWQLFQFNRQYKLRWLTLWEPIVDICFSVNRHHFDLKWLKVMLTHQNKNRKWVPKGSTTLTLDIFFCFYTHRRIWSSLFCLLRSFFCCVYLIPCRYLCFFFVRVIFYFNIMCYYCFIIFFISSLLFLRKVSFQSANFILVFQLFD